ncbi:MAG: DUF2190 family protein [Rhizonema sp. NSF051]|nr:DUF2190 family protein [Rhizonema sp. NSF051]
MAVLNGRFDELIVGYKANAVIYSYRIVKLDPTLSGSVIQAAAKTDFLLGVSKIVQTSITRYQRPTTATFQSAPIPPAIAGDQIDVNILGIQPLQYGAAVTIGQPLTTDTIGRGIPAASGDRCIGIAMSAGALDDIGSVLISQI